MQDYSCELDCEIYYFAHQRVFLEVRGAADKLLPLSISAPPVKYSSKYRPSVPVSLHRPSCVFRRCFLIYSSVVQFSLSSGVTHGNLQSSIHLQPVAAYHRYVKCPYSSSDAHLLTDCDLHSLSLSHPAHTNYNCFYHHLYITYCIKLLSHQKI